MNSDHGNSWDDGAISAIEQEAADWLVLDDRGFTSTQRDEFKVWLEKDARHREIYAELKETWRQIGRVPESRVSPEKIKITVKPARRRMRKILWVSTTLAAAAAMAVTAVTFWHPTVDAGGYAMTTATEIGGLQKVSLPDGSVMQVNTDSAVSVQFTSAERRVRLLRGEAHFQVTKNPSRPFIVSAGKVAVRAVGTAFDVRLRTQAIDVLVTEGKVRVNDLADGHSLLAQPVSSGEQPLLIAGQRVSIPLVADKAARGPATATALSLVEIGQALAWQSKRLEFVSAPLVEMVDEFNRYNRHKLVIADARLEARRFGGTFAAGDYDEFVRLLEADFGVIAERGANETKLRLAP